MDVIFLGVGEAFDEEIPNTSILVRADPGKEQITLLLDCGYSVPPQFWKQKLPVDELDGIWISHFHGDHTLGLPALLVRFWEERRRKPLTILGQKGIENYFHRLVDVAYQGFEDRLKFPISFIELEPDKRMEIFGLTLKSAENNHSRRDLALKIEDREKVIYYSGDGSPTPEGLSLASGCDLMIQESFHPEVEIPGHATANESIDAAIQSGVSNLALVHIERGLRKQVLKLIKKREDIPESLNVFLPEPGDRISL
jgi:ribonuclease BN (tRNA processing enzyme)